MLSHLTHALSAFLREHYRDVGLVVGTTWATVWALYNVTQRGSLHPLLDLKVSGRLIRDNQRQYLLSSLEVSNVHLPMVRIEFCGLRISSNRKVGGDSDSLPVTWVSLTTAEVLAGQDRIWAGETLRDEMLLTVPLKERVFRLLFRITSKQRWYERPFNLLLRSSRLKRFAPRRRSWYAAAIVEGYSSELEVKNEGNHPSGRTGNGRGNEELERSDREDEGQE